VQTTTVSRSSTSRSLRRSFTRASCTTAGSGAGAPVGVAPRLVVGIVVTRRRRSGRPDGRLLGVSVARVARRATAQTILAAMSDPSNDLVRVAIVEDQPLFRSMLERTLDETPGLHVVASVGTVTEATRALRPGVAHVAVLDIDLPDGNGIALGVTLRRAQPDLGILLLSAHDAMDLLLDLPRDVAAGWGYLSKTSSTSEEVLVAAVRAAAVGETVLDPALLARMTPRAGSAVARLTDRQYDVLRLLAAGLSNAGIGSRLGITEKSVQNHVNGMYATLGIDTDPSRNPRVSAALRLLEETGPTA
jgi:DNA-binding NarL/FixJ family response regulator